LVLFVPRLGKKKIASVTLPTPNEKFHALPEPTGTAPYHLPFDKVISREQINRIGNSGSIAFHIVSDTGGTKSPTAQHIIEVAMESDFDRRDLSKNPSFLYHLGDIVYKFGEASEYYSQFYEPYAHYPAPIFAIPGNKDGDVRVNSNENSLEAFVNNFCAKTQEVTPDAGDIARDAMIQPNVYWTLHAPFVTIIGLYSNVPDGGVIKENQFQWLENELKTAPTDKAMIFSVHHSPLSADEEHSGLIRRLDNLIVYRTLFSPDMFTITKGSHVN